MQTTTKPKRNVTQLEVQRKTHARLFRYMGILTALRGERVTVNDAVSELLDNAERFGVQQSADSAK